VAHIHVPDSSPMGFFIPAHDVPVPDGTPGSIPDSSNVVLDKGNPLAALPATQSSSPSPQPAAPSPTPNLPTFVPMTNVGENVKLAPLDTIVFDNSNVEIAQIEQLLFEDIGGVELSNISRADLIDGQQVSYSPIANLETINRIFNPNNIVATNNGIDYFSRFSIDLSSRAPISVYFDTGGNLVVEVESVNNDEQIQVEILTNGTINLIGSDG